MRFPRAEGSAEATEIEPLAITGNGVINGCMGHQSGVYLKSALPLAGRHALEGADRVVDVHPADALGVHAREHVEGVVPPEARVCVGVAWCEGENL